MVHTIVDTSGIIFGRNMKTAISISDQLLQEADETARIMGLSRSGLFALAMRDFLHKQRQEKLLHQLNEVYGREVDPAEKRLLTGMKSKFRSSVKENW